MILTQGFVLVCESFEFEHDYVCLAFSENKEDLEKIKPSNCLEKMIDGVILQQARSYYIYPLAWLKISESTTDSEVDKSKWCCPDELVHDKEIIVINFQYE